MDVNFSTVINKFDFHHGRTWSHMVTHCHTRSHTLCRWVDDNFTTVIKKFDFQTWCTYIDQVCILGVMCVTR